MMRHLIYHSMIELSLLWVSVNLKFIKNAGIGNLQASRKQSQQSEKIQGTQKLKPTTT